jgi:hypothetical protein
MFKSNPPFRRTRDLVRPLQQILAADAAIAGWTERQRRESGILRGVQSKLPPALAAQVTGVSADAQELVLIANSGAAAALLRQRLPALAAALEHGGWKFTVIRVRVQARQSVNRSEKRQLKQLDKVTAANLLLHARALEDGTLREALSRLVETASTGAAEQGAEDAPEKPRGGTPRRG